MGIGVVAQKRNKLKEFERNVNLGRNKRFSVIDKETAGTRRVEGFKAETAALVEVAHNTVGPHKVSRGEMAAARGLSRDCGVEGKGRRKLDRRTFGNFKRIPQGVTVGTWGGYGVAKAATWPLYRPAE